MPWREFRYGNTLSQLFLIGLLQRVHRDGVSPPEGQRVVRRDFAQQFAVLRRGVAARARTRRYAGANSVFIETSRQTGSRCRLPSAILNTRLAPCRRSRAPRRRRRLPPVASARCTLSTQRARLSELRQAVFVVLRRAAAPVCGPPASIRWRRRAACRLAATAKETSVGRNVEFLKRTAHRVLAADGGDAQLKLRLQRAQQCLEAACPSASACASVRSKYSWKVSQQRCCEPRRPRPAWPQSRPPRPYAPW